MNLKDHELADQVLHKALQGALDTHALGKYITVDKNLVDAFTSRLLDAGVDLSSLDRVVAEGDPDLIDPE